MLPGLMSQMNDLLPMRVFHGGAHVPKQPQAVPHRKLAGLAPGVDSHPFHMLQHQIGQAVFSRAAIEKADDVGVLQARQHLAFARKRRSEVPVAALRVDQLDGNLLMVLAVRTLRQVDGSHASVADLAQDLIRAHTPANQ